MDQVVRRYRTVIILISIAAVIAAAWLFIGRNANRAPSRGVFVMNKYSMQMHI